MKTNSQKVLEALRKYKDIALSRKTLSLHSGVPVERISDCIYRLITIQEVKDVYAVDRGYWIYSPDEVLPRYESPVTRLHTFITEAGEEGVTVNEIADAFEIDVTKVPSLVGRMVTALGQKPTRIVRYTFNQPDKE